MAEKVKQSKSARARFKAFFPILIWSVVAVWCVVFLFMVAWGLMTTFKSAGGFSINSYGIPGWVVHEELITDEGYTVIKDTVMWEFNNYGIALQNLWVNSKGRTIYFGEMFAYTLYYCVVYGFLAVAGPMLCSYIYAKYNKRVPWVKSVWVLVLVTMYVPLSASLAASLKLAMQLNIYNNLFLFVFACFGGFGGDFLIYYAIWKGLSWEYAEAAFMDGASHWTVLTRIMFPMTLTVFWVLFITKVITYWVDYTTPMIYLPSFPTIAYGVFNLQTNGSKREISEPVRLASLYAMAVPMFILFIAFREKMMGSLTMGGLKG